MVKPMAFFQEVQVELSKVTWPTRKESIRLSLVVIITSALVGLFIGGVDFVLTKLMSLILGR